MFNLRPPLLSLIGPPVPLLTVSALMHMVILATATPALAQELSCGGTTVRLVCDRRDGPFCLTSHAEFILSNGQTRVVNTPRYLRSDLFPAAAGCAHGDGGDYLVVTLTNGGNCDECERWALFKTDGTEITKGGGDFDTVTRNLHVSMPYGGRAIYLK